MEKRPRILQPPHNCWQIAPSPRAAFLVDGDAYFAAVAAAIERARESVLILAWDIDSRVRLRRDGQKRETPGELGKFLNAVVARRPKLHVHILDWDFAMLYALEREALPIVQLGWRTHRRVHFHLDDRHPLGASHHQKIVVIDDRVAFVGGFDLAQSRWDTAEHAPDDPRRLDSGVLYPPFHDVQMLVDGAAAVVLGDLARARWERATGEKLPRPGVDGGDPWPAGIRPDLCNVEVAVARTDPFFNGNPEVREGEALFRDAIAAARSAIYIENQYLTSATIGAALAARLLEEKGPEIVLVLPRECSGWLEEKTMGALRTRLLRQLRDADRHRRLRVYYPDVPELREKYVNVHSKVMIVDDVLVRVGSANLSNRSMGLDTECDLAVEADREETRAGILAFRHRLLAEHLGTGAEKIAAAVRERGSLIAGIEALTGGARSLEPLNGPDTNSVGPIIPEWMIVDPERPMSFEQFVEEIVSKDPHRAVGKRLNRSWLLLVGLLLAALALAAAWRWTPLREVADLQTLESFGREVRGSGLAPVVVIGTYVAGGLTMVPVTLLILTTALVFSPPAAFIYALAGSLASALATFGLGRLLGGQTVRRLAGGRLNRLSRQLARRGILAVTIVRLLPVAPFSIVNLVAGAAHIGLRDFTFGTALGMAPGILAITVFEKSLEQAISRPGTGSFLLLAAVALAVAGSTWVGRRWLAVKAGTAKVVNGGTRRAMQKGSDRSG
jgi:phosphatidylserine/phosphatidylglycerophosphate/cardiolipin synthase-like enzyme/uncharacterized membrane protein YdjX (TVP38/TMEM64 family)